MPLAAPTPLTSCIARGLALFLVMNAACGESDADDPGTTATEADPSDGGGGGAAQTGGSAASDASSDPSDGDTADGGSDAAGSGTTEGGDTTGSDGDLPPPLSALRVVFSGHSLTDVAVPTIRDIAAAQGDDLRDIYQSIPGSPIRSRTRGGSPVDENSWDGYSEGTNGVNLIDELRTPGLLPAGEVYDTLVITDRHDLLGVVQWESTASLLRHFHDRLLEGNPEAQSYFYHAWLDVDKTDPQIWIDYERDALVAWECVSTKVNLTLEADGLPTNLRTIPAGWALTNMVEAALAGSIPGLSGTQQEILDAIFSDNVHLTSLGSLYVGAFTYASMFHKFPEGASIPEGASAETVDALLTMAWSNVEAYAARPDGGTHTMETCREHVSSNVCPVFWGAMFDQPGNVAGCQGFFGGENPGNPFRWPDPDLEVWPAP